jgi:transcriptional regulator with XRE-family HTH domain
MLKFLQFRTDDEIAALCRVSTSTVYRWRTGRQSIPYPARRLLELIHAGRIIPDSWRGFRFGEDERLWSPIDRSLNKVQIEQFVMLLDFHNGYLRTIREQREYIEYLETLVKRAKVVDFPAHLTRPSLTEGQELNALFQKKEKQP